VTFCTLFVSAKCDTLEKEVEKSILTRLLVIFRFVVSVGTVAFNGLIYLGIVEQQRDHLRRYNSSIFEGTVPPIVDSVEG
jgi:hypothetical protein